MINGAPIKLPLAVDLHINKFVGGQITEIESGVTNIVYGQYTDGRWYATQRPGINLLEDASETVSDARGRGAYYWDAVSDEYIVNNDTVYKSSYAGSTMTISAGTNRVFIGEVGSYLVIIDYENNEGWYISSGAPTTINAIADLDFPPNQTPALSLAQGGCIVNGKLYVLTTAADIYECDLEDPTSWNGLNFRAAEISSDKGVCIVKHDQHAAVFGTRSLEFFQDTGNSVGSTLTPRTDIDYSIGMINEDAFWEINDQLYFVGQDASSNAIGVYALNSMQLSKISDERLDAFLTTAINNDGYGVTLCGFVSGGRVFCVLTVHTTISDIAATETLVYSASRDFWSFWDVQLTDVDLFPLVSWMPSSNTRIGTGLLANGDLITVLDDFNPADTVSANGVFEDGVFEIGVFTATSAGGTNIPVEIITGTFDGGTSRNKRMGELRLNHIPTNTSEDLTVSYADEQSAAYTEWGTIDVSDGDARLNRGGKFRRRNLKLAGTFSEEIRLESLEATVRAG